MCLIRGEKHLASGFLHILRKSVVDGLRRVQSDAGVMMLCVIPGKEDLTETSAILDAAESVGEVRHILERLELRLGKWIIITRIRSAVGLSDAQIGQEQGQPAWTSWTSHGLREQ